MPRLPLFLAGILAVAVLAILPPDPVLAEDPPEVRARALLLRGDFAGASELANEALAEDEENMELLAVLETALTCDGETKKAARVARMLEKVYAERKKKGEEVPRERMRVVRNTENFHIIASEMFEPDDRRVKGITDFYRIVVLPRKGPPQRLFHLEMSELLEKFHVLRETLENGGAQIVPYGPEKPSLGKVLDDLVAFLEPEEEKVGERPEKAE